MIYLDVNVDYVDLPMILNFSFADFPFSMPLVNSATWMPYMFQMGWSENRVSSNPLVV